MRPIIALSSFVVVAICSLGCAGPAEQPDPSPQTFEVALLVPTPSGLPKCEPALAGTTAYVATPAGLWTCPGDAWIPLPCTKLLAGAVAYASSTASLWACTGGQWKAIDLPAGATGPAGPQGATGPAGPAGPQGAPGPAGASAGAVSDGAPCESLGIAGTYQISVDADGFVKATCVLPPADPHQCLGVDVTSLPHATASCPNHDPVFESCDPGYVDYDGVLQNGCEGQNVVADGGFEHLGLLTDGWMSDRARLLSCTIPHSGSSCLVLDSLGVAAQTIAVPADATALHFWFTGEGTVSFSSDFGFEGHPLSGRATYPTGEEATFSLEAYRGLTIQLTFSRGSGAPATFYVDDVSID